MSDCFIIALYEVYKTHVILIAGKKYAFNALLKKYSE